jgi:hypothetical protein
VKVFILLGTYDYEATDVVHVTTAKNPVPELRSVYHRVRKERSYDDWKVEVWENGKEIERESEHYTNKTMEYLG